MIISRGSGGEARTLGTPGEWSNYVQGVGVFKSVKVIKKIVWELGLVYI